jgi:hypothetical protein
MDDLFGIHNVRLGYARASTAQQSLNAQLDSLAEARVTRIFSEKISTRATRRPERSILSMALHLRDLEMSLRDIAKRLVITTGAKKGQHPSPATVMRMLREHDEQTTTAAST